MNIPQHVAIILDGNGRWAKSKGMPRNYGHKEGSKNVERMCEVAYNRGVKYLTVYAFSTENWKRSATEVEALMQLLRGYMKTCLKRAKKNNMRIRVIGDISKLDAALQKQILELEEASKDHTGLQFQIALNYGSRDEIRRAVQRMMADCENGKIASQDVSEDMIASYLDTAGIPDPDLLIRTSGEERLSNFLMWQLAYTEFYFTEVHWPDFSAEELEKAIEKYNGRNRRFGAIEEEDDV